MTTHHFQPVVYYNTFGSHPPALRISPGDRVVTSTLDAWGGDAAGATVAGKPNPQTGPFLIEGAEPGDTLVVTLERLGPNRASGFSRSILAEHVVDPNFVRQLPENQLLDWNMDASQGTASLISDVARLSPIHFPLRPMLGCLGVAPGGGQAISTATSGDFGGNMDYRGFTAGVSVYFPVFVPGALFFLGDGHALQGDGELVGTGIETSFDVTFSVNLQKGKTIRWPRGENANEIFTLGNGRPLDQALSFAVTEMLEWLVADYRLDLAGASTLLGMMGECVLGNVFDPAYTMVCKLPKGVLAGLGQ